MRIVVHTLLYIAVFLLLTGICYDTETSVILLHLNSAFA